MPHLPCLAQTRARRLADDGVCWSRILILSGAVFFNGNTGAQNPASLFDAYDLLRDIVGQGASLASVPSLSSLPFLACGVLTGCGGANTGAATLFALALLASGQSSSIIATMAGQTVSEGFLRWRVSVRVLFLSFIWLLMCPRGSDPARI